MPVEFWGTINASDGQNVTVTFNGSEFGDGSIQNGFYSVIITADNPLTYLDDPTCASHSPCIPCSTVSTDDNYCIEGPTNGSSVTLNVGGNVTNATLVFDENPSGEQVDISLTFTVLLGLSKGFNLISIPIELDDFLLSSDPFNGTPQDCVEKLFRYNSSLQQYQSAIRDADFGWGSGEGLSSVEGGRGYWIKTASNCNVSLSGTESRSLTISLKEGFNLIGWYSHEPTPLENLTFTTNETDCVVRLYQYNETISQYGVAFRDPQFGWGSSQGVNALNPGRGYWLRTDRDCTWNFEP